MEAKTPEAPKERVLFAQMIRAGLWNHVKDGVPVSVGSVKIMHDWAEGAEREYREAWELIAELAADVECYCADNVVVPGPCARCKARAFLARGVPARR